MRAHFVMFFPLFPVATIAMISFSLDHCITEVAENVYTGSGKTKAGEEIFFGMEKLDSKNIKNWELFKESTLDFVFRSFSPLTEFIKQAENTINPLDYGFNSYEEVNELREQVIQKAKRLEKSCHTSRPSKYTNSLDELSAQVSRISAGVGGFRLKIGDWVAYASKVPVNDRFDFSSIADETKLTLKEYKDAFGNILMAVCTYDFDIQPSETYENRGIFRNPFNFLEGTYNHISLVLHGFSAAVVQLRKPDIKFMQVSPTSSMQRILFAGLGDDDLFLEEKNDKGKWEYVPFKQSETYKKYQNNEMICEVPNRIKIESLANIYNECCRCE